MASLETGGKGWKRRYLRTIINAVTVFIAIPAGKSAMEHKFCSSSG